MSFRSAIPAVEIYETSRFPLCPLQLTGIINEAREKHLVTGRNWTTRSPFRVSVVLIYFPRVKWEKKKKEKDEKKKGKGGVDSNARDTRSDKIISREIYHRNRASTIHFRADRPLSGSWFESWRYFFRSATCIVDNCGVVKRSLSGCHYYCFP